MLTALKNCVRTKARRFASSETRKKWDKKSLYQTIIILCAFVVGLIIPGKIAVTLTNSLNHHLYYISRLSPKDTIHLNDYVLFKMKESKFVDNKKKLDVMKIVVCGPGDVLKENNRQYRCNGNLLGTAKEQSLKGEKVDNFKFNGIIPPDNYFVMGQHKDSWDSRYFGFVERKDVKAITYPLF